MTIYVFLRHNCYKEYSNEEGSSENSDTIDEEKDLENDRMRILKKSVTLRLEKIDEILVSASA